MVALHVLQIKMMQLTLILEPNALTSAPAMDPYTLSGKPNGVRCRAVYVRGEKKCEVHVGKGIERGRRNNCWMYLYYLFFQNTCYERNLGSSSMDLLRSTGSKCILTRTCKHTNICTSQSPSLEVVGCGCLHAVGRKRNLLFWNLIGVHLLHLLAKRKGSSHYHLIKNQILSITTQLGK